MATRVEVAEADDPFGSIWIKLLRAIAENEFSYTITESFRALVENELTIMCENWIDKEGNCGSFIKVSCGRPMESYFSLLAAKEDRWLSKPEFEAYVVEFLETRSDFVESTIAEYGVRTDGSTPTRQPFGRDS